VSGGVGAEQALEGAILDVLASAAAVKAVLGDPPRVFEAAEARPAFPYLEIVRHEVTAAGSQGVEANEHRVDLAIASRDGGRAQARAAIAAVRDALAAGDFAMEGWRCILLAPVFADMVRGKFAAYRALIRIKAVVERV
jgi:hypothetical protein